LSKDIPDINVAQVVEEVLVNMQLKLEKYIYGGFQLWNSCMLIKKIYICQLKERMWIAQEKQAVALRSRKGENIIKVIWETYATNNNGMNRYQMRY